MNKLFLAVGATALAMTPALAENGKGNGGGKGGNDKGDRGAMQAKGDGRGGGHDRAMKNEGHRGQAKADRQVFKAERNVDKQFKQEAREGRRADRNVVRDRGVDDSRDRRIAYNGAGDGCPPGLAKKNNGCLPPGQAKKLVGFTLPAAFAGAMLSGPYANWYRDDDRYLYRMSGDDIYRVNRGTNLIDALIPFGGNDFNYYPVGMNYPADYNSYNVPYQYRSFYPDGGDYNYRFGDNAIYSVDPSSQAIQGIVALLAGDLGVGQRLPSNYGVYNVPMSYRDRYYDSAENMYRYNDGYIYRVDPKTQLITSVINALI